jgi:hypothetical protein
MTIAEQRLSTGEEFIDPAEQDAGLAETLSILHFLQAEFPILAAPAQPAGNISKDRAPDVR